MLVHSDSVFIQIGKRSHLAFLLLPSTLISSKWENVNMFKIAMLLIKQIRTCCPREQVANKLAYLLELISGQAWHLDRALAALKSDQKTLPTQVFNLRDVEAH